MKYILFYTEGCTPHVKYFTSKKNADSFVNKFLRKYENNEDNWVDCLIKGNVVEKFSGFEGIQEVKE